MGRTRKKLLVKLTGKQKPTKGQLELFETNEYRQGLDGKQSIQGMKYQAFLYSRLDIDSMGTGDLLRKQRLPLEWVLEFLSSQPNQNKIPRKSECADCEVSIRGTFGCSGVPSRERVPFKFGLAKV